MVFIRPTIVRTASDAQRLTAERYDYIRDAEVAQRGANANPSEITSLDALVRDYLRAAPPSLPPVATPLPPRLPPK
jgi:general secretion pathway protein D